MQSKYIALFSAFTLSVVSSMSHAFAVSDTVARQASVSWFVAFLGVIFIALYASRKKGGYRPFGF